MTKEISILSTNGKQVGQITLDDKVFGVEPNLHVMHMALRRQLNNARSGNACAKTRAEVSGGGRKPWKQKGTGREKARKLALKSALSARLENTVLVKDFSEITEAKTKMVAQSLKAIKAEGKILIVANTQAAENGQLELAARNLPNVKIILPSNLNVKDLLEADTLVMTEAAILEITERLSK